VVIARWAIASSARHCGSRRAAAATLRATAFWVAVLLPVVYLPLLFVDGGWTAI
jgi:hypothetical protein